MPFIFVSSVYDAVLKQIKLTKFFSSGLNLGAKRAQIGLNFKIDFIKNTCDNLFFNSNGLEGGNFLISFYNKKERPDFFQDTFLIFTYIK